MLLLLREFFCVALLLGISAGIQVQSKAGLKSQGPSQLLRQNVNAHVPSLEKLSSELSPFKQANPSAKHFHKDTAVVNGKAPATASTNNLNAKHEVAAADSLLTAFGSLDKKLNVAHCLPETANKIVKDFQSIVQPNPIKKGSPLKIESHSVLVKEPLTSGNIKVSISAFGMSVLTVTGNLCQAEKRYPVPMMGDVVLYGTKCPKMVGQTVDVSIGFTVPEEITAGLPVGVKIEASNQDGSDIMCEDTNFMT